VTNPISRTAFYCTGVRALDARSPRPLCGDRYAERFMDEEAWRLFAPFRHFRGPNGSNVVRHRILDDLLRSRLLVEPRLRVVIVGAGFDSRAFRLGGGRWVEVEEAPLLDYKEQRLPAAACPQPLQRIAIDFARDSLAEKLAPFAAEDPDAPAIAVVEGVLMYLSEAQIRTLLGTLGRLFPHLEVACDVATQGFIRRFASRLQKRIGDLGASFATLDRPLEAIFADCGFEQRAFVSIPGRAAELRAVPAIERLVIRLWKTLRDGYTLRTFSRRDAGEGEVLSVPGR
jgi:methyltransferase (TIGR00027 family)